MSAPAVQASARLRPETASNQSQNAPKFGDNALCVPSVELLILNSRFGGGCADLP
jgi:hypothetical protein